MEQPPSGASLLLYRPELIRCPSCTDRLGIAVLLCAQKQSQLPDLISINHYLGRQPRGEVVSKREAGSLSSPPLALHSPPGNKTTDTQVGPGSSSGAGCQVAASRNVWA